MLGGGGADTVLGGGRETALDSDRLTDFVQTRLLKPTIITVKSLITDNVTSTSARLYTTRSFVPVLTRTVGRGALGVSCCLWTLS